MSARRLIEEEAFDVLGRYSREKKTTKLREVARRICEQGTI